MGLERLGGFLRRKPRSRVTVGFHRVGIVLAVPLLAAAGIAAVWQWQQPTGPLVMVPPVGTLAWGFGDDADAVAQLGSRLIKSTIPGRLQDRRTPSSFGPTYRIVWRCA
jgi:hypothetical protein